VRESAFKRALVSAWFTGLEVRHALTRAWQPAGFTGAVIDYEQYWKSRGHGGVHPRFGIIADGMRHGDTVLDVGCGDGTLLRYLRDERGTCGIGIDVSAEAVARVRAQGIEARQELLSAVLARDGEGAFDHVVMSEVVEHVADAEGLVADGWRLARQSLWLTFPNIAYFPHRLRLLCGRFPVQWVVFPGEHLRFWSVADFQEWIAGLGLPAPMIAPSNGVTIGRLHRAWPNLLANQVVARVDRSR
jgi:methionine biosynthesis protein MetW